MHNPRGKQTGKGKDGKFAVLPSMTIWSGGSVQITMEYFHACCCTLCKPSVGGFGDVAL